VSRAGILIAALLAWPALTVAAFIPENQRSVVTVTFNVSPEGDDSGDGIYRLIDPLRFGAADGGLHHRARERRGWRGSLANRQHAR
jgi:hypothetical protein